VALVPAAAFGLAVGAAMAGHAVLQIPDSLALMLGGNPVELMLKAAIAGIAAGIVADMACRIGRIVAGETLIPTPLKIDGLRKPKPWPCLAMGHPKQ